VAGNLHRRVLGDVSADHVADAGAPQVVDEQAGGACGSARVRPRLAEAGDRPAGVLPLQPHEDVGDHATDLALDRLHARPVRPKALDEIGRQERRPPLAGLRLAGFQAEGASPKVDVEPAEPERRRR